MDIFLAKLYNKQTSYIGVHTQMPMQNVLWNVDRSTDTYIAMCVCVCKEFI